jgi:hypothetical protein
MPESTASTPNTPSTQSTWSTPSGPARRAWVGPLVATVLTLPVSFFAFVFAGLAPMACDSCDGAEADRFTRGFDSAYTVFQVGVGAAFVLLLVSWCLPWSERNVVPGWVLALLPPLTALFSVLIFASMVPWPS